METTTDASSVIGDKINVLPPNDTGHLPTKEHDEICFIGTQTCCVCFIDIVDSTRTTSNLDNPQKIRKYYSIFLNSMAAIARGGGAKIIKNIGDSLVFY